MLKNKSRENKIAKNKKSHHELSEFYTQEQKHEEIIQKKKKSMEDIEMEIFEHLKNHTKKVLKK